MSRLADVQVDIRANLTPLRGGIASAFNLLRSFGRSAERPVAMRLDGRQAAAAVGSLQRSLAGLKSSAGASLGALGGVGKGALAAFGGNLLTKGFDAVTGKIGDLVERGKSLNAFRETAQGSFAILLKSGEKAKAMLSDLEKFSFDAGMFDFEGITQAAKKMLAFNFEPGKVIPTLKIIADAAAVVGDNADDAREKLGGIALALGQMRAGETLKAEELNQLIERGIPAWKLLSDATGKSISQLKKLQEQGKLSGKVASDLIIGQMEREYGGAVAKQSGTYSGMQAQAQEAETQFAARAVSPMMDEFKVGFQQQMNFLQSDGAKSLADTMGQVGRTGAIAYNEAWKAAYGGAANFGTRAAKDGIGVAASDGIVEASPQIIKDAASKVIATSDAVTNAVTGIANKIAAWKIPGFRDGGPVSGPGTTTSDSIPALLSRDEYVMPAAAAQAFGYANLDAIRAGRFGRFNKGGRVKPDPKSFIAAIAAAAQASQARTGVPASVAIAQAILESNSGASGLARKANNFFGIKGRGPEGSMTFRTREETRGGKSYYVNAPFRAYANAEQSFEDHGRFLRENKRYAGAFQAQSPVDFARAIQRAGYATDNRYAAKIEKLINSYDLTKYDSAEAGVSRSLSALADGTSKSGKALSDASDAIVNATQKTIQALRGPGDEAFPANARPFQTRTRNVSGYGDADADRRYREVQAMLQGRTADQIIADAKKFHATIKESNAETNQFGAALQSVTPEFEKISVGVAKVSEQLNTGLIERAGQKLRETQAAYDAALASVAKSGGASASSGGTLTKDEQAENFKKLSAVEGGEKTKFGETLGKETVAAFSTTIRAAFAGEIDSIGGFFKSLARTLGQSLIDNLFKGGDEEGGGGGLGGLIGKGVRGLFGLFGGGKASGGRATSGVTYQVNEFGTEFLTPIGGDVNILNALRGGRGGQMTQTNNFFINSDNGNLSRESQRQLSERIGRQTRRF
jgi:tape measure domain-containing protein